VRENSSAGAPRLGRHSTLLPRLAPWAVFLRRFAAGYRRSQV